MSVAEWYFDGLFICFVILSTTLPPGCKRCLSERAEFMRAASRLSSKKQYTLAAFDCSDHKGKLLLYHVSDFS